jgi:hypothetical protein
MVPFMCLNRGNETQAPRTSNYTKLTLFTLARPNSFWLVLDLDPEARTTTKVHAELLKRIRERTIKG